MLHCKELAERLHVPRAARRSTGPIDLLQLASKTRSEAGKALGSGEEVECRPMWRRPTENTYIYIYYIYVI